MKYSKQEFGMVAAIIADTIYKRLYAIGQDVDVYFIPCAELIANWSEECMTKLKDVDWEKAHDGGQQALSKEWKKDFGIDVEEWDSAVIDFAMHKLELFKLEHNIKEEPK